MSEHLFPEAAVMLERAQYFARFLGHQEIAPEDLLAGYMLTEKPHRMLHVRMSTQGVFDSIFLVSPRGAVAKGIEASSLPLSFDPECSAIIQIAVKASIKSGRLIEVRDLMAAILRHQSNRAVDIIIAVTSTTPDELLENLLQQPA